MQIHRERRTMIGYSTRKPGRKWEVMLMALKMCVNSYKPIKLKVDELCGMCIISQ